MHIYIKLKCYHQYGIHFCFETFREFRIDKFNVLFIIIIIIHLFRPNNHSLSNKKLETILVRRYIFYLQYLGPPKYVLITTLAQDGLTRFFTIHTKNKKALVCNKYKTKIRYSNTLEA